MTTVLLYGDKKDKSLTSKLCHVLSDNGGVLYFSDIRAVAYGNISDNSFILLECDSLSEISIEKCIVIFKSKQSSDIPVKLNSCITAIIEKGNTRAVLAIKNNKNPCVTCGMSGNDTVTISSINDTNATVSLQRSVFDIYGSIVEPCDITVNFKNFCDGFTLLSSICVLIISNKIKNGSIDI